MENKLTYLYSLYELVKADMDKIKIPYTKNVKIKINTRAKRMHGCCRKVNGSFVIEVSDFLFNYSKKMYRMKKSKLITNPQLYRCSKCKGKLIVYKIIKK